MWIVKLALQRPYTFIVMALLILLMTPYILLKTPVDILPEVDIPVVSIVWSYNGLSPEDMGNRIVGTSERSLTTTVDDIEHIESQSFAGIAVIKIFFQPNANIQTSLAQVVSIVQTQLKGLPTGITPPLIIKYTASSVPVIQMSLSSNSMSEQAISDTALVFFRTQLITIPGISVPYPYGGKQKVISVDLDTQALIAKNLTPTDVVNALGIQNLILPSGTIKMGKTEYSAQLNGSPDTIEEMNNIPVRTINGATTYLREVAHVRDGFLPQTNLVRENGQRGVLVSIIKNGKASTLEIVDNLKKALPMLQTKLPAELNIKPIFDQSIFVKSAITGVLHEAIIAASLTALLILLFLGNWRSTAIIAISIPLSILISIFTLHALGETINIMTLGGLALAVGILVDDATVTIENIERQIHSCKKFDMYQSIIDGAGEIAIPALVSTLCICIVFAPMFFLTGVAKFLFAPLAEAVIFAMLASYLLSRTLVPTLVMLFMKETDKKSKQDFFTSVYRRFNDGFEKMREAYTELLGYILKRRFKFGAAFLSFCVASLILIVFLGRDFFPAVDSGKIRLHVRAPTGMRIEETASIVDQVEHEIRAIIPQQNLETIVDNIGLPYSGINTSYNNSGTIGTMDAEVLIALKDRHPPTVEYINQMRINLPKKFPGVEFFFQPADIVTQILNFGRPAAIDIQFSGKDIFQNYANAAELMKEIKKIPGAVDVHIHQLVDQPVVKMEIDRTRAQQVGVDSNVIAQNILSSLSGSFQTSPSFWLNPKNGVVYNVVAQTPQYQVSNLDHLLETPINTSNNTHTQLLGNLVNIQPLRQQAVVSHYDISPVIDLYVSVEGRDLGSVADQIEALTNQMKPKLTRGSDITIRGAVNTMNTSFFGLEIGFIAAIVLVYLLLVVNFQSWIDPFIIITALPAAIAGIVWMLFLTQTTLSIPALTGAIMTMGVATANSILMVSFARDRLNEGLTSFNAALQAANTRIRPVLMTALAMIIGMIPMALGLGDGGEQNAPLGRAVIGGLLFATISTLFFVPIVFTSIHEYLSNKKRK